jgi:Tfp pilus assembly protein FimT
MTIVIGVIALMAMIAYPNINNITNDAQNTVSNLNEKTIQQASIMGEALNNSIINESSETDIGSIGDLQDITVSYTGSDSLYLLISTDGSTWYSYRDTLNISKNKVLAAKSKIAVNTSDKEDLIGKGLSITLFNDLTTTDWNDLFGENNKVYFAYYSEDNNGNNTTLANESNINIEIKGNNDNINIENFKETQKINLNPLDPYALNLNGNSDYVTVPSIYNDPTLTVSMRIKFNSLQDQWLVNKRDNNGDNQWQLIYYEDGLGASIFKGPYRSGIADTRYNDIETDKWYQIGFTTNGVEGGFLKLYVNGELVDQSTLTDNMKLGSREINFGSAHWSGAHRFYVDGKIDNIHIWNKTFSNKDFKKYLENQPYGNEKDLLIHYAINSNGGNVLKDYSLNNYDATINGGNWVNK